MHSRREIFQRADIHTDILCNLVLDASVYDTNQALSPDFEAENTRSSLLTIKVQ